MGMDLIVGVAVQNHPERTVDQLREKLEEMSSEEASEIFENVQGVSWEELNDEDDGVLDCVKTWINEFIDAWDGSIYHRSLIFMEHPNLDKIIAIGGGDSWGYTPEGLDVVTAAAEWGEW